MGILGELVELFGSQTPDRLINMRRAIEAGDAGAVSGDAHQLKGGCLTLAANHMAELCDELERSAGGGSLEGAAASWIRSMTPSNRHTQRCCEKSRSALAAADGATCFAAERPGNESQQSVFAHRL